MNPNDQFVGVSPFNYVYDWKGVAKGTQMYRKKSSLRGIGEYVAVSGETGATIGSIFETIIRSRWTPWLALGGLTYLLYHSPEGRAALRKTFGLKAREGYARLRKKSSGGAKYTIKSKA